eukprot:1189048-Prorocentrum_minimum.AAC.1
MSGEAHLQEGVGIGEGCEAVHHGAHAHHARPGRCQEGVRRGSGGGQVRDVKRCITELTLTTRARVTARRGSGGGQEGIRRGSGGDLSYMRSTHVQNADNQRCEHPGFPGSGGGQDRVM